MSMDLLNEHESYHQLNEQVLRYTYIPTVTLLSKASPVLPSYKTSFSISHYIQLFLRHSSISSSVAPSNTGVAICQPN